MRSSRFAQPKEQRALESKRQFFQPLFTMHLSFGHSILSNLYICLYTLQGNHPIISLSLFMFHCLVCLSCFTFSYCLTSMFPGFAFSLDFVCQLDIAHCVCCITCTIFYSLFYAIKNCLYIKSISNLSP